MKIGYIVAWTALYVAVAPYSPAQEEASGGSLSPSEADAIVAAQMEEQAQQRQAKIDELESAAVIESAEVDWGDRKVIFNRVIPADSASFASQSVAASGQIAPVLTEAERAALRERYAAQARNTLCLSATVFEDGVTELRWSHEGKAYRAFANVNFEYLAGLGQYETGEGVFTVMMTLGRDDSAMLARLRQAGQLPASVSESPRWHPTLAEFPGDGVQYLVVAASDEDLGDDAAFAGIEAMLRYYQEHEAELLVAHQRRIALEEARQRYVKNNPPQPVDTIINFSPSPESKSLQNR